MSKDPISPGRQLTVIIRNDAPMLHCGDSPSYRTVRLTLTEEQERAIMLEWTCRSNGGSAIHESISQLILER